MDKKDLDYEFDFEKEYGIDPLKEQDDDFDLDALLASDYGEDDSISLEDILHPRKEEKPAGEPKQEPQEAPQQDVTDDTALYDFGFQSDFGPQQEEGMDFDDMSFNEEPKLESDIDFEAQAEAEASAKAENFELDHDLQVELGLLDEEPEQPKAEAPEEPETPAAPAAEEKKETAPVPPVRRRRQPAKKSFLPQNPRELRKFKNEMLPRIIAGVAAVFLAYFVIGAVVTGVRENKKEHQEQLNASIEAQNQAQQQQEQVQELLDQAAVLAAGYDYDGAIALIDGFEGDKEDFTELQRMRAQYVQTQSQMKAWEDPSKIANLSFHVLIADPSRAFSDQEYGKSYNRNFVTIGEFSAILDQLYSNGCVLVDFDSFVDEVTGDDGHVSYHKKPLYLPDGKKPIMLTETMVNYFNYMVDSNSDGMPDKGGDGFASKLVVDENGAIKAEMVDAEGNTVVGNYDLVPILDDFIKAHPDFSYRGAKATLAVTGHEGVFGYRTNKETKTKVTEAFYQEQVEGAKKLVEALRADGYEIASYSFGNLSYGKENSATRIKEDLQRWNEEVTPVLGNVDVMVYARGSDIAGTGNYSGSKYDVLRNAGFRYFVGSANAPWADITDQYVRQQRLMVTGSQMAHASSQFADFFNAKTVLDQQRGKVPQ